MKLIPQGLGGVGPVLVAVVACALALPGCRTSQVAGKVGDRLFSRGGLAVRTEPSGAMVYINENRVGRTPLTESLQAGMCRVLVKKRGFESQELWLEVPKGKTREVSIRLEQR